MSEMGQGTKRKKYNINANGRFQSSGIILWSRHSVGGLSCLGGGLRSLSALVIYAPLDIHVNSCVMVPALLQLKFLLFDITITSRNNGTSYAGIFLTCPVW